ncbi:MAG: LCP family protein [Anaerolineales bacterium]
MSEIKKTWIYRGSIMIFLLVMVILIAACSPAAGALIPGMPLFNGPLITQNPNATATATPFKPEPVTATPLPPPKRTPPPATPTSVDPWGYFQPPVEPSAIDIRRPMHPFEDSEEVINFMFLGSDQRPNSYGHRTDTIMLLSFDLEEETVTLMSIPRDLYIFIPGWRVDRINTADARGGPERVQETMLYNFGIEVDHWARIRFSGFKSAVNMLGGIDVDIGKPMGDECGGIFWHYGIGTYHMDGFEALCYVRMRKSSGGDFDRLRRQQEVIVAIFNKALSLDGLSRVPDFFSQFSSLVETDVTLEKVLPLLPLAAKVASDPSKIRRITIDSTMGSLWRVPYSGASVVLPNWEAIEPMLERMFAK